MICNNYNLKIKLISIKLDNFLMGYKYLKIIKCNNFKI